MKKLTVAVSPLTGVIYAGTSLKSGVWAAGKQDVTEEAMSAVAQSLLHQDIRMEYTIRGEKYILQLIPIAKYEVQNP